MKVEFIRFKTADDVELQGWLSNEKSDIAAIHMHGRSGNGYENYFLDNLRDMYSQNSISFFSIDNRGRGFISDFRKGKGWKLGGSVYEIFEECIYDIQGAIDYLKTLGKKKFILQGHSLGCTKVVHFLTSQKIDDVIMVILIAPTDMVGLAELDPNHESHLIKAKKLVAQGKGEELVDINCWIDKIPISAQTYPTVCDSGSAADIYGFRKDGSTLGKLLQPALIIYGDKDVGIVEIDGSVNKWLERTNKIKNNNTQITIIPDAEHSYRGHEQKLASTIGKFVGKYLPKI